MLRDRFFVLTKKNLEGVKDFGWVAASQFFTAISRFLILAFGARELSATQFGDFAFFVALSLVVGNLAELGFGRILVRFVGVAAGAGDDASAKRYCSMLFQLKLLLSIPVLVFGLTATYIFRGSHDTSTAQWAILVGVVSSFGPLVASVFQVQGKFREYFFCYCVDPLRFICLLSISFSGNLSLQVVYCIYLFSPLVVGILLPFANAPLGSFGTKPVWTAYLPILKFGKWLMLITLLESLWQRLDVLMLQGLAGPGAVGQYSAVYMFMGVAALMSGSISTMVYPRMAESQGRNASADLAKQYVGSTRIVAQIAIPCVAGIAAIGPRLVQVLLGSKYQEGAHLFPWLAVYGAFLVLQSNTGAVFFAIGRPALNFYWILFLVISGLVGNFIFIPIFGPVGAAAVLGVSTAMGAVLAWSLIATNLGVWPDFKQIAYILFKSGLLYLAVRWIPLPAAGIVDILLRTCIATLAYILATLLLSTHFSASGKTSIPNVLE